ncbi:alpha-D-ribose 1-methylphosphonate 5-triphosphate diphosphatase [Bordetella genomosp. 2]|uniref:Alpha-D-ribose 1-methylphosphonate 5-triphosphate diphosphatase n=1 Tax=Bordetella genomosp. 2 TaxID=1983456 RepID=A0A261VHC3_9BORD|nr:alpha-D-ribose 1-methylphosphonate 5-triphosphate diphosphatase [Bordetella genomosp. 2]OZI73556.1 alpha-D-ribose 1-methylphosphonate 5-triphosphate diphosphatase [Bordetella genomosp. 2]
MNPDSPSPALAGISGNRVLTPAGLGGSHLVFRDGRIGDPGTAPAAGGAWLDAGDLLVLPGIVDLHGDAFERAVMPRPGVTFPYDAALHDVDRQLLANGITTEFHGVTLSWEGGLRGEPYAERMFECLERMREALGARHHVHLRFETHHVDGVGIAQQWIRAGRVQFLALNDHLPGMARRLGDDRKLLQYADRAECDLDTFQARIRQAMAAADDVGDAMRELARSAREAGLSVASHDDPDAATRRYYHQLGCRVAEFPLTAEAARVARDLGDAIVFGAPNVVRGRSHTNAPNAAEMVRAGLCDILTSDYYYPAPLAAALRLADQGILPLPQAWRLVSANPARAAGLADRGTLAAGQAADAIVVDDSLPGLPRVCAAIVGGVLRHATRSFEAAHAQRIAA